MFDKITTSRTSVVEHIKKIQEVSDEVPVYDFLDLSEYFGSPRPE